MIRLLAVCMVLALAAFVAACGGDDDSTASVTPSTSGSAEASGSPTDTPVPTTPGPTATPTPTPFTNWTIAGQVTGAMFIRRERCTADGGGYRIALNGQLAGVTIGIVIATDATGTIDFSQANPAVSVAVQYGGEGASVDDYWFAAAGDPGTAGAITLEENGTGTFEGVTVPPSSVAPAGATAPVTVAGPWICT